MGEATTAGGVTTFRFATASRPPGEFRTADGSTGFSLVATAADPFGASRPGRPSRWWPSATGPRWSGWRSRRRWWRTSTTPRAGLRRHLAPGHLRGPDGDPLRVDGSVGDAACAAFTISGGAARVACQRAYAPAPGLPPLSAFLGDHRVVTSASDAWVQVSSPTTVNIQDGAPSATAFSGAVESCYCPCPKWSADGSTCLGQGHWTTDATVVPLPVTANDADGDPVQVTYGGAAINGGAQKTVLPTGCGATLNRPSLPVTVAVTIDDGLARVSTTSTVTSVFCSRAGLACTP